MHRPLLLLLSAVFPLTAQATEILDSSINLENGRYSIEVNAHIDAPLETVLDVITDYENLPRANPSITESHVLLAYAPNRHRVHTVIRACILFFCKSVNQVQDIKRDASRVEAVILPELSDFRMGSARWSLFPDNGSTRMHFSSELEPDFWIPPLIGPWLIQQRIHNEIIESGRYMEQAH